MMQASARSFDPLFAALSVNAQMHKGTAGIGRLCVFRRASFLPPIYKNDKHFYAGKTTGGRCQ